MKKFHVSVSLFNGQNLSCVRDDELDIVAAGCLPDDAAMFSASPEMLEALEEISALIYGQDDVVSVPIRRSTINKIEAAIAKAQNKD